MNIKLQKTKIRDFSKKLKVISLLGGKCKNCNNSNIFHLVCHHKFGKDKNIASLLRLSWSKIIEEVKKCELLCANCHMEYHYNERTQYIKNDSRRKNKILYLEYRGAECIICGYNKCEASLSFHHRDPNNKKFNIGSTSGNVNSLSDIKSHIINELDKCDVICRNCHMEHHKDVEFYHKHKDEILFKVDNLRKISTKIDRSEVFHLYKNGFSNKEISEKLNCASNTISEITKHFS